MAVEFRAVRKVFADGTVALEGLDLAFETGYGFNPIPRSKAYEAQLEAELREVPDAASGRSTPAARPGS